MAPNLLDRDSQERQVGVVSSQGGRGHTVVHLSQRTVTFYHSVQNFWDNKLDRPEIGTEKNEMRVNLEEKNWAQNPDSVAGPGT